MYVWNKPRRAIKLRSISTCCYYYFVWPLNWISMCMRGFPLSSNSEDVINLPCMIRTRCHKTRAVSAIRGVACSTGEPSFYASLGMHSEGSACPADGISRHKRYPRHNIGVVGADNIALSYPVKGEGGILRTSKHLNLVLWIRRLVQCFLSTVSLLPANR